MIKCKHDFYNITQLMELARVFSQKHDLPDSVLRESLVGLVSVISEIGSYFPRNGISSVDVSVTVFTGICPSLCNIFTGKGRIIHLNQLDYKVRAVVLKTKMIKCKHDFYNITQLIDLVKVFSQNYNLPDSVLRRCRESLVPGTSLYFPRDGTSSVDISVTVFSGICPSLCNIFTMKAELYISRSGMVNSKSFASKVLL